MTDKAKAPITAAINKEFAKILTRYLAVYKRDEYTHFPDSFQKKRDFVKDVNEVMEQRAGRKPVRVDELHPLTTDILLDILECKVGPTTELVQGMLGALRITRDYHQPFLDAGKRATEDETKRRKDIWDLTPEGQAATQKQGLELARVKAQNELLERQKSIALAAEKEAQLAKERKEALALAAEQEEQLAKNREETLAKEQEEARAKEIAKEPSRQARARLRIANLRIESNKEEWQKNNPKGMKKLPSFQEMLETSHANGEDFRQFLFERVMPTWNDISQVKFCKLMKTLNRGKEGISKPTVTDTVLSQWHSGKTKPLRDSVDVICSAFGIAPSEGELMALHEKMLWKTIDGHEFSWGSKKGISAIEIAIDECKKTGDTGALVRELMDSSGIRFERLREKLNVQQLSQWMKGATIANVDMAVQFLQLVNPQPTEEVVSKKARSEGISRVVSRQNREILSLLTQREFDIEEILRNSNKRGNPSGELFAQLTGRNGLVTLTPAEIIVHFNAHDLACNEHQIKKMRTGSQLQRGGKISEAYADEIVEMVKGSMQHLVALGVCKPFTEEQEQKCIDMLTGEPHPKAMLKSAVAGKLAIGELVRKTCERLGMNHVGEHSFCEQVGISHMSDFVLGKANLQNETAQKMAAWFVKHYEFDDIERQQFIDSARGLNLQRTSDDILDAVKTGSMGRLEGLRAIYDNSSLTRDELADGADVARDTIKYSVTKISTGRIIADKEALQRIGKLCKISDVKLGDFIQIYDGHQVSLKAVKSQKPDSWQDLAKATKSTGGWARTVAGDGSDD